LTLTKLGLHIARHCLCQQLRKLRHLGWIGRHFSKLLSRNCANVVNNFDATDNKNKTEPNSGNCSLSFVFLGCITFDQNVHFIAWCGYGNIDHIHGLPRKAGKQQCFGGNRETKPFQQIRSSSFFASVCLCPHFIYSDIGF